MWLFVMFDLPVETGEQRRRSTRFRKDLLDLGFEMSQFSIYLKYCASSDKAESISRRVQGKVPPEGKVDVLTITDKQFGNIHRFYGGEKRKMLKNPANCTCSEPVSLHLAGRNRLRTDSLGAVETNTQGWAGLGQRSGSSMFCKS